LAPPPTGYYCVFIMLLLLLCIIWLSLYVVEPKIKKQRARPQWSIITVQPWTDGGAIDKSNEVEGGRQRNQVCYKM
jgi:hypothetical protein